MNQTEYIKTITDFVQKMDAAPFYDDASLSGKDEKASWRRIDTIPSALVTVPDPPTAEERHRAAVVIAQNLKKEKKRICKALRQGKDPFPPSVFKPY